MDEQYYLDNTEQIEVEDYVTAIRKGIVKLDRLLKQGLPHSKRKAIVSQLDIYNIEDEDYQACRNSDDYRNFIIKYPQSIYLGDAEKNLNKKLIEEEDEIFETCITSKDFKSFLQKYPESKKRPTVEKKISDLKRQEILRDYEFCSTIEDYKNFLSLHPKSELSNEARQKIEKLEDLKIQDIIHNNSDYTPDEIVKKLNEAELSQLGKKIKINPNVIKNFSYPDLGFDNVPTTPEDLSNEIVDVFFWGIPSSGKTCSLAAILFTMDQEYNISTIEMKKNFGTRYRNNLTNIFKRHNGIGYLPNRTARDRTQYMPFRLKRKGKNEGYRRLSFFELSGEMFRFFYELANNTKIMSDSDREGVLKAFQPLNLLLNNESRKIHLFFIDYSRADNVDNFGLTQKDYLAAAKTYFANHKNILKDKTDALYVIVTKADEIEGKNDNERTEEAKNFLQSQFSGFLDELETQCKKSNIKFQIKIFSIGDVFFKRIARINKKYSKALIDDLLEDIDAEENGFWKWIRKTFN